MAARAVPAPLAALPNAITVARLAAVPLFVALYLIADHGHSWWAGTIFGVAGVSDQVDGFLARRLHVESQFGKIADPLADRLLIDAAVILLFAYGYLPWVGLVVILARDSLLLVGYRVVVPRGYDFSVSFLGKAATWFLYVGIAFLIAQSWSPDWPLYCFWAGLTLAVLAAALYVANALRAVRA